MLSHTAIPEVDDGKESFDLCDGGDEGHHKLITNFFNIGDEYYAVGNII